MTSDTRDRCERQLFELTRRRAVALTFSETMPPGLARESAAHPSGCTFWKLASEGRSFYTEAVDHFGCAVGAYTHGAELPDAQTRELSNLITTMVGLAYIKQEEVPQIPHRAAPLRYVIYSPLSKSAKPPDTVLVRGNSRQLMLLAEAARSSGHLKDSSTMGRPACAMVPESISSGQAVLSLGCVGNRIYTGLADEEGYMAIPGCALEAVCSQLEIILKANQALAQFHSERQAQFATAVSV